MNAKHFIVLSIAGAAVWALASSCGSATGDDTKSETKTVAMVKKSAVQELNEASKGQTIVTPMGKTIKVRLKSNRTTGYGWKVSACDDKVLKAAGEPAYETPDTQMMGAGGHDVFTFEPVKPGQTVLKLDYVRSWEKNTPPEQTWSVTITVLPKPPANRHGRRS